MTYTVNENEAGARLDAYLASVTGESRSAVVRAIDEGRVCINGKAESIDKKYKVKRDDEISFEAEEVTEYEASPENIPHIPDPAAPAPKAAPNAAQVCTP